MTLSSKKDLKWIKVAELISEFSPCLRSHFGAAIVKDGDLLGTGYNGPARGVKHCETCRREGYASGQGYELCIAMGSHAEQNAIINSGGRERCMGASLYIGSHNTEYGKVPRKYNDKMGDFPCNSCARAIINAGIEWVIQREGEDGVTLHHIPTLVDEGKLE